MTFCPKCGHERQPKEDDIVPKGECPKCGIVYEKYAEIQRRRNEEEASVYTNKWANKESRKRKAVIFKYFFLSFMVGFIGMIIFNKNIHIIDKIKFNSPSPNNAAGSTSQLSKYNNSPIAPSAHVATNQMKGPIAYDPSKELSGVLERLSVLFNQPLSDSKLYHNQIASYQWDAIRHQPNYTKIQSILYNYHRQHTYMSKEMFVCLDMAVDIWNLMETAGIKSRLMLGYYPIDNSYNNTVIKYLSGINHAWVMAEISPSLWIPLETTGGFIVDPSVQHFRLYNQGIVFDNPKICKEFDVSRHAMIDTCNETVSMRDNFNRLFAGEPITRDTTEYTGRMKQKVDDCEHLIEKVTATLHRR